ncbi:GNAT family N-acetyltransferase [Modestobacter sp. I12A-02628]|uniref:GNAT family N-acetyltransferase n=1 Tax=Goekera deserti TaxID=2497753 RepID=A0A7K3WJB4_9ACTN|nr:GNAT family N-acetyltransferase [Goekera deserti]MPQ99293.1 GNAT family N-acetyltransferase [Goekera deserti]NDI50292.1 GNAT family N-acetyltransferase [Goekera deserti]NEL56456.1 GNAT family N-acetyltransferase [Goekera deserti]
MTHTVPTLRWLTSPAAADPALRAALTACWRDVANGGGAVGFARQLPVSADVVRPVLDAIADGLGDLRRMLVAERDGELVGWLVLTGNASPVLAHWGHVTRVMTTPAARGTGVARALVTELHRAARDDLGLDLLRIEVRGRTGLEDFYARFGYTVVGRWPGALQIGPDDRRDELLMSVALR